MINNIFCRKKFYGQFGVFLYINNIRVLYFSFIYENFVKMTFVPRDKDLHFEKNELIFCFVMRIKKKIYEDVRVI